MEIYDDLEGFLFDNLPCFFFQFRPYSHAFFHDRSLIKKDVNSIWINLHTGAPQRAENSPPMGILTEESGLHQWRMGNRISSLFGIVFVSCTPDQDFDEFRRPLSILHQTFSPIPA